jgi:hypothetical protein
MRWGGTTRVEIAVGSLPARLVMDRHTLEGRCKRTDARDICNWVRNHSAAFWMH